MWIETQDNTALIEAHHFEIVPVDFIPIENFSALSLKKEQEDENGRYDIIDAEGNILGMYWSKQRDLKVLKEIKEALFDYEIMKIDLNEFLHSKENYDDSHYLYLEREHCRNAIFFKMPKNEEIKIDIN